MTDLHYCAEAFRIQKIFRYGMIGIVLGVVACRKFK